MARLPSQEPEILKSLEILLAPLFEELGELRGGNGNGHVSPLSEPGV